MEDTSMDKTSDILVKTSNGILTITFNTPKKLNAISHEMYILITDIVNKASSDEEIHMIVFTGNGIFFSSGNDMTGWMKSDPSLLNNITTFFKNFVDAMIKCTKLLVAIVNGPAIGIGTTMLGLCDMVYASEKAYFMTPFSKLGLSPEACSSYIFPRLMGSKAGDMLYLGYKMDAMEAKQFGLVSEVYKEDRVEDIWNYLNKITSLSKETLLVTKKLIRKWNEQTLLKVNEAETQVLQELRESPELLQRVMMLIKEKSKL